MPSVARLVVAQIAPPRPFARGSTLHRTAPFAVVAVLAELSSLLAPGPRSSVDIWVSLGLLGVCALAIRASWDHMPGGLTILVPLLFEASVLWLRLGQGGPGLGVATLGLIPLVWTVLYQRRWESFVVVASIVLANLVAAPLGKVPAEVVLQRAGFWAMLGIVIALTVHDLRDRMDRALARQQELTRRASAMNSAARALTSLLDVDAVVRRAIDLAVELVSPPQRGLRPRPLRPHRRQPGPCPA